MWGLPLPPKEGTLYTAIKVPVLNSQSPSRCVHSKTCIDEALAWATSYILGDAQLSLGSVGHWAEEAKCQELPQLHEE